MRVWLLFLAFNTHRCVFQVLSHQGWVRHLCLRHYKILQTVENVIFGAILVHNYRFPFHCLILIVCAVVG